ncbi:hypothetical protein PybrP1_007811 [[Pythium] brassicae (nom. inval.)]|nr:hypothetical protein PybrP1_007811 [[Pythium] brassicae (nom. inval.)]
MTTVWTLDVATRCEALQALLAPADRAALRSALLRHDADADSGASSEQSGGAASSSASSVHSSHLERWTQWKLDATHIARLTSASVVPDALHELVADARFFARGKRGVLFAGELKPSGDPVVVKLGAADSGGSVSGAVDAEAKWLRFMNRLGIGARVHASGSGWVVCERIEGVHVVDFLGAAATTQANARWVLREMLLQCFAMDLAGVNKDEMTHPHRHILVRRDGREWRCTFIDFEKCALSSRPKNFLCSPRMVALFSSKSVVFDVPSVRLATKRYKQSGGAHAFAALARVFGHFVYVAEESAGDHDRSTAHLLSTTKAPALRKGT